MINRRGLITGLISFVAAPAIVRASSLMPVKAVKVDYTFRSFELDILYDQCNILPEWMQYISEIIIKSIPEHYNT